MKNYIISVFPISRFIPVMAVSKCHIMMLDLWMSTDSYDCRFICIGIGLVVDKHIFLSSIRMFYIKQNAPNSYVVVVVAVVCCRNKRMQEKYATNAADATAKTQG